MTEVSIFIAKILGPIFAIVGVALVTRPKMFQAIFEDFVESPALMYIGAIMALSFGIIIVLFNNIWEWSWAVFITILGWLSIIKGVSLLLFPGSLNKMIEFYRNNTIAVRVHGAVAIVLGLLLIIMGYVV